ncbi:MAG: nitroreductase family protein [Pseudomonadales bacterium]
MSATVTLTTDELLTTTRAVRKRLDFERSVPMAVIRECLEIALQAPTGSNAQGWHRMVVTDADKRPGAGRALPQSLGGVSQHAGFRAPGACGRRREMTQIQEKVVSQRVPGREHGEGARAAHPVHQRARGRNSRPHGGGRAG